MANKKLSLKVLTEKKPALGSYEPALSPKTAPNSFSHPEDALDLDTYIGQVAPAFVLPNVIELDGINEATLNGGVTIDGLLLKDGVYAFPASMVSFASPAGNNAATATQLTGKFNWIGGSGSGGVVLPASPLFGQVTYVTNTIGSTVRIYGNPAGGTIIKPGSGFTSSSSDVDIKHNETFKFTFVSGSTWITEILVGPSTIIQVNTISERTGTAGVTIDDALIKDGSFTGKQATATATSDGLTTGLLTGADQFVSVTSANADHIVALPITTSIPLGTKIRGFVGANGCEIRANATQTVTINGVTSTNASVEAAIAANTMFEATFAATATWFLTTINGTTIAAPTPDAV